MDNTSQIALTVFALDPSTTKAGAAIVQFGTDGSIMGAWAVAAALDATANKGRKECAKFDRISYIRKQVKTWVEQVQADYPVALDVRAYEAPYADFELAQAAGACLTIPAFDRLPVACIRRAAACKTAGCYALYMEPTKGKTAAQIREKQARLKAAVMLWATTRFAGTQAGYVAERSEHAADALAVADTVYQVWAKEEAEKANVQKPLLGPGSGQKRGVK